MTRAVTNASVVTVTQVLLHNYTVTFLPSASVVGRQLDIQNIHQALQRKKMSFSNLFGLVVWKRTNQNTAIQKVTNLLNYNTTDAIISHCDEQTSLFKTINYM